MFTITSMTRTRFAPSPTGYLHVGGIRTAIFAWLIARQGNGQFILRLEDTDKNREVEGSAEHLIESLKTLGLNYDEGPDIGGKYGPYKQSERLDIYKKWAEKLIASGRAYADPYSQEEVQGFRELAKQNKKPFLYRNHRPKESVTWDGTTPLRFKSDPKEYSWNDAVMGNLKSGLEVIDDFIIMKSDGYPTYNFAHIIDDYEMEISHIIRGQEFISSVPNYLNLYEALGIDRPIMATVPHILGPTGNKKLSKRDGAKDMLDYTNDGYLVEALFSFIATLGWNDGTTQEIFTKQELIKKFSLERVQKNGARFDEQRLKWMNGSLIRDMDISELYSKSEKYWPETSRTFEAEYKVLVLKSIKERLKFLAEIPELTSFYFQEPDVDLELIKTNKQLKKLDSETLVNLLEFTENSLNNIDFSIDEISETLNSLLEKTNQKPAVLFSLIRISTTWATSSPKLDEYLSIIGKDKTLERINLAKKAIVADSLEN